MHTNTKAHEIVLHFYMLHKQSLSQLNENLTSGICGFTQGLHHSVRISHEMNWLVLVLSINISLEMWHSLSHWGGPVYHFVASSSQYLNEIITYMATFFPFFWDWSMMFCNKMSFQIGELFFFSFSGSISLL